jgi:hypothetical protein
MWSTSTTLFATHTERARRVLSLAAVVATLAAGCRSGRGSRVTTRAHRTCEPTRHNTDLAGTTRASVDYCTLQVHTPFPPSAPGNSVAVVDVSASACRCVQCRSVGR